ncbi:MAG: selenide, water dikinase SelD [Paracoccaceae bacterium]
MRQDIPATRDILLVGGGHAHAVALRMWAMDPLPGARLTLVNPDPTAPYTGMLPGLVAGHYRREELEVDMVRLARFAGARIILDRVTGLDREGGRAIFANRPPVEYDIASINVGITTGMAAKGGVPVKPMGDFAAAWDRYVSRVAAGEAPRAAVVGGGVAGTELAMAMAYRLNAVARGKAAVALIEAGPEPMPASAAVRKSVLPELRRMGIDVRCGSPAVEISASGVKLANGDFAEAGFVAEATGARPAPWLAETGLQLKDGFVRVAETLQSVNDPAIFAAGDTCWMEASPRAKAGVFAVRQGPVLAHNLRAAASGGRLRPYRPQRDYLKLISLGGKVAVAEKYGRSVKGAALWRLKDRIDRRFMARLSELEPMNPAPLPATVARDVADLAASGPLCGGCGSKLGRPALAPILSDLAAPTRPDVLSRPGDDAAVLAGADGARQVITTDHLRAFTDDPFVMAGIAATHAMGDVWAMGAEPQTALASIVLPPLAPRLQRRTLAEIMTAATDRFGQAGADVVGGHSSQGAELTIGFTVTGLADGPTTGKAGARPDHVLILTKPIGVGVILAAEMRLRASGHDVAAAHAQMAESSALAARLLRQDASAMSDVTGFGLAGHLHEVLEASDMSAEIDLASVPFLPAAVALGERGIRSSLFAQNAVIEVERGRHAGDPRCDLLFDPQTSGGLLAALPPDAAARIIDDLRKAAPATAIIGRVVPPRPVRIRLT